MPFFRFSKHKPVTEKHILLVGDYCSGRTSFLWTINRDLDVKSKVVFESRQLDIETEINHVPVLLSLSAQVDREYYAISEYYYGIADAAVICFALDSPESVEHATGKWMEEVATYCKDAPVFFLGCKKDLRTEETLSEEDARAMAHRLNVEYVECSANTGEGVQQALDKIYEYTIGPKSGRRKSKRRSCQIL